MPGVIVMAVTRKRNCKVYLLFSKANSWFAINLSGCGTQCQPPTPAGSDNGTNKIFLCVVPPTWPPYRQMQTINSKYYFIYSWPQI